MLSFSQLKKNLKKDFFGFEKIKIAVLGDTATQFLVQSLRATGYNHGFNLEIFESDFNQIERQVHDPSSELYKFMPEVVIVFKSSHKLLQKYNKLDPSQCEDLAEINEALNTRLKAKVIYYNYPEINDSIFGNYANKINSSFLFQLRKLNLELMVYASNSSSFFVCDLSSIQNLAGKSNFFQSSVYVNTEMVLSLDVLPVVAASTVDIIGALNGRVIKCVILDLDNTIWGGIIGDDGLENIQLGSLGIGKAFTEFQYWIKKLKDRGIIVAVCSKNTEAIAKEPFEKHPDMILRLEDISVFVANWENKVNNICQIQEILNIGFDSMVFLDDNPFERNIVRENIPGIIVPELPEDPAEYLEHLYSLNLFETISFSGEDRERTRLYKVEAQRNSIKNKFINEDDFLESLNMFSLVESFNKFNTPRVAQLSQRSNQFNLRTVRYSELDIGMISTSDEHYSFSFTLEDKFGDNGLICVVILKKEDEKTVFIDTWFMSCRVLKRGMEHFVLNTLANFARKHDFAVLKGEYVPTAKNEMVKDHYKSLGFDEKNGFWIQEVMKYRDKKCFIKTNKNG